MFSKKYVRKESYLKNYKFSFPVPNVNTGVGLESLTLKKIEILL